MYRLKIDEGGEAAPPALILATSPEHLDYIRQYEDREELIAKMAGALAIEEFTYEGENVGFGSIGVVSPITEEETHLVLRMPSKKLEHGPKHRAIKEIAATLHVATDVLNSFCDNTRNRLPRPQIHLTTAVSVESDNYYSHYTRAKLAPELVKIILGLSEQKLIELERQTERNMTLFADHLVTGTDLSTIHASIDSTATIQIDCPGGSSGIKTSSRGYELVGYDIDTTAQQIMLIGGLAAMATYATR